MKRETLETVRAAYRQRRSAHTPAAQGSKWIRPSTRWAIYHRDDFACVYCGTVGPLSLDHVHSVEGAGRDNSPANLVTCCVRCNSSKQALPKREWYAVLRGRGVNIAALRRRIARQTARPIDRERGRFLASAKPEEDDDIASIVEVHEAPARPVPVGGGLHVRPLGAPLPEGHGRC